MHCPFCKNQETTVKDSRIVDEGFTVRRRRECPQCNHRFSTYEKYDLQNIIITKKNGKKQVFDINKLTESVNRALKRESESDKLSIIINDIIHRIQNVSKKDISSKELGEVVMESLKEFDKLAFIRFASVYQDLKTIEDFYNLLSKL